jgi:ubiquinone/menaquinone biosynthesis C-methylase UbiE
MKTDPYAKTAARYDRATGRSTLKLRAKGMEIFPPRDGLKMLDVGCGTGEQLLLYRRPGCQLYGVDVSPSMLAVARRKLGPSVTLQPGDAAHMSFPDGTFDLVTCVLSLHEMAMEARPLVLRECRRVTRQGGSILLIDFHYGSAPFPRGWLMKMFIVANEMASGREHYARYRDFLDRRGLDGLVQEAGLTVAKRFVFDPGIAAICLLSV